MATIFNTIPQEIFINWIVLHLPAGATYCFSRVSKAANEVVLAAANAPHEDITLEGKTVLIIPKAILGPEGKTIFIIPDSIALTLINDMSIFLRQKVKMEALRSRPELSDIFRNGTTKLGLDGRCIGIGGAWALLNCALDNKNSDLALSTILFDFKEKFINPAHLCETLRLAIDEGNLKLMQAVFAHSNVVGIADYYCKKSRIDCLKHAIEGNKPKFVRALLSHPKAADIPAEDIRAAVEHMVWADNPNPELIEALLSHPNAAGIRVEELYGQQIALEAALSSDSPEVAEARNEWKKLQ